MTLGGCCGEAHPPSDDDPMVSEVDDDGASAAVLLGESTDPEIDSPAFLTDASLSALAAVPIQDTSDLVPDEGLMDWSSVADREFFEDARGTQKPKVAEAE